MGSPASEINGLLQRGDLAGAESLCVEALARAPHDAELNALGGFIAFRRRRYDAAIAQSRRAIELAPHAWIAHFVAGMSARALGRREEARQALAEVLRLKPDHAEAAQRLLEETLACGGPDALEAAMVGLGALQAHKDVRRAFARLSFLAGRVPQLDGVAVRRLVPVRAWAEASGSTLQVVGPVEAIPIQKPPTLAAEGFELAGPLETVASSQPYVAELRDVTVLSKTTLLFTADGCALHDAATHPRFGDQVSLAYEKSVIARRGDQVLVDFGGYAVEALEAGVWLSGLASDAFGHWVPEFLPKLEALSRHPEFAALPIIVDAEMPDSHFGYLSRMTANRLVRVPAGGGLKVGRLVVAPAPGFYPTELAPDHQVPPSEIFPLSPRALEFVRGKVRPAGAPPPSRFGDKLYLSRRNMQWRRMVNDAEVSAWLEARGFRTILIETHSLEEQIEMFSGARVIVAPNGSSLLNILFAPPELKLVVLSQKGLFNWGGFYGPLHRLGYEMTFVCGDEETGAKHADYRVPLARLEEALAGLAAE